MSDETGQIRVLEDKQGNLYWLPEDVAAALRVPDEAVAQVRQALDNDVSGFLSTAGFRTDTGVRANAGELSMMELQSMVSHRSMAIKFTSNMMQSLNASNQAIVGNIR